MDVSRAKVEKNSVLKKSAHFADVFQIYPSMLETFTAAFTISTLVQNVGRNY